MINLTSEPHTRKWWHNPNDPSTRTDNIIVNKKQLSSMPCTLLRYMISKTQHFLISSILLLIHVHLLTSSILVCVVIGMPMTNLLKQEKHVHGVMGLRPLLFCSDIKVWYSTHSICIKYNATLKTFCLVFLGTLAKLDSKHYMTVIKVSMPDMSFLSSSVHL